MRYVARLKTHLTVIILLLFFVIIPYLNVPTLESRVLAQCNNCNDTDGDGDCDTWFNGACGTNGSPLLCDANGCYEIGGGPGGPPPNPDKPSINAGDACQAGDSRTINLGGIDGDGFTIDSSYSPDYVGGNTSRTFINLPHATPIQYRAEQCRGSLCSGISDWTPETQQDQVPPTTSVNYVATRGNNDWFVSDPVSTSLLGVDDGCLGTRQTFFTLDQIAYESNADNVAYIAPLFDITGDGRHPLTFHSTDGHNIEVASPEALVKIDTVPPEIEVSLSRNPDQGGTSWYREPVTLYTVATDATSGVIRHQFNWSNGWENYKQPLAIASDGIHHIEIVAEDEAG